MNGLLPLTILLAAACVAGCAPPAEPARDLPIDDLRDLPQDAAAYVQAGREDERVLSQARQAELAAGFAEAWYGPWRLRGAAHDAGAALARLDDYRGQPVYGGNCRLLAPAWFDALRREMNLEAFGRTGPGVRAVTLRNTHLRKLPTWQPVFTGIDSAEDYYPFDELQVSAVWGGTPVYVTHLSADGAWALAEAPYEWGWLPASDLAGVDDATAERWQGRPLAALLRDKVSLRTAEGRLLFRTHMGAAMPLEGRRDGRLLVLAAEAAGTAAGPAQAGGGGGGIGAALAQARTVTCILGQDDAHPIPLPATHRNLCLLANRLLGQPYAWGGLAEDRDCSSTLRDVLTPLGLFLPRNSVDQYRRGRVVDVSGLSPPERERRLLAEGVPWLTLVYARGHIMLYVGRRGGRAIILHNFWAVRTLPADPRLPRRHVVGQAVLTTLQPGRERSDFDPAGDLLNRIDAFTVLADRAEPAGPAGRTSKSP